MRINTQDMTLDRNYLQKYQFLLDEYELIKVKKHPKQRCHLELPVINEGSLLLAKGIKFWKDESSVQEYQSSAKSFHPGFTDSMSFTFLYRFHPFKRFSLSMARPISSVSS